MKREIKFRGLRVDGKGWAFGCLTRYSENISYITEDLLGDIVHQVTTETVGQYTGQKDKSGKDIYEGDCFEGYESEIGVIEFVKGSFVFSYYGFAGTMTEDGWNEDGGEWGLIESEPLFGFDIEDHKIIGSIHDNPELLKTE